MSFEKELENETKKLFWVLHSQFPQCGMWNVLWSELTAQLVAAFACVVVYHGAYDEFHRCVDCRLAATKRRRRQRRWLSNPRRLLASFAWLI